MTGTIAKDGTVAYADIKYKSSADDIKDYSIKHLKDSLKMADDEGLQTEPKRRCTGSRDGDRRCL